MRTKFQAGDVIIVNLNPTQGHEKSKTRPCLILEPGSSPLKLVIVLPITEASPQHSTRFFVSISDLKKAGLTKPSAVDCYQIRSLSTKRIFQKIGSISDEVLDEVKQKLAVILDIGEEHIVTLQ